MPESLIELRKKPHLSISALKCFLSCPRKYALQYTVRARPDFVPAALVLGSAWHSAVAAWLDQLGDDAALDERLREDLRERLRGDDVPVLFDGPDENAERFIERAVVMFKKFRDVIPRPKEVIGTEIAFETEIVHPQTGEVLPLPVIGALDAIVIEDDGVCSLLEHKTSRAKWPTSGGATLHDPQMTLYKKVARQLGHDDLRLRVIVVTKAEEPQVQRLDIDRSDADETELAELFFDVHRAIEAGVRHRQRGWACASCAYSGACR